MVHCYELRQSRVQWIKSKEETTTIKLREIKTVHGDEVDSD